MDNQKYFLREWVWPHLWGTKCLVTLVMTMRIRNLIRFWQESSIMFMKRTTTMIGNQKQLSSRFDSRPMEVLFELSNSWLDFKLISRNMLTQNSRLLFLYLSTHWQIKGLQRQKWLGNFHSTKERQFESTISKLLFTERTCLSQSKNTDLRRSKIYF